MTSVAELQFEWMDTFSKRLTGALTRPIEKTRTILVFSPGGSIHTFFMRYDLHIFFLDAEYKIIKGYPDVKPWRVVNAPQGTHYVAESAASIPYMTVLSKLTYLMAVK